MWTPCLITCKDSPDLRYEGPFLKVMYLAQMYARSNLYFEVYRTDVSDMPVRILTLNRFGLDADPAIENSYYFIDEICAISYKKGSDDTVKHFENIEEYMTLHNAAMRDAEEAAKNPKTQE